MSRDCGATKQQLYTPPLPCGMLNFVLYIAHHVNGPVNVIAFPRALWALQRYARRAYVTPGALRASTFPPPWRPTGVCRLRILNVNLILTRATRVSGPLTPDVEPRFWIRALLFRSYLTAFGTNQLE